MSPSDSDGFLQGQNKVRYDHVYIHYIYIFICLLERLPLALINHIVLDKKLYNLTSLQNPDGQQYLYLGCDGAIVSGIW